MSQLFVRTGIHFSSSQQALEHIGAEMLARGVVHDSYPAALLEREATFPTGIALEQHAVAIPHCEAVHAKSPARVRLLLFSALMTTAKSTFRSSSR